MSAPMTNKTTPNDDWLSTLILQAMGEESAVFMSQPIKGTEIVMPEKELTVIAEKLTAAINRQALATALRLIGNDEPQIMQGKELEKDATVSIDFEKDDPMEIMVYCQSNGRNMIREELRQAFTDYYGGGNG